MDDGQGDERRKRTRVTYGERGRHGSRGRRRRGRGREWRHSLDWHFTARRSTAATDDDGGDDDDGGEDGGDDGATVRSGDDDDDDDDDGRRWCQCASSSGGDLVNFRGGARTRRARTKRRSRGGARAGRWEIAIY